MSFLDSEETNPDKIRKEIGNKTYMEYSKSIQESVLFISDIEMHLNQQAICKDKKWITMTQREFSALLFLAKHPNWVFSKKQIYEAIYGQNLIENVDNSIYCLIRSLRKKLEKDPQHPKYIQTVRGTGYKFVVSEK